MNYNIKECNEKYESNNTCEFPGICRKWITITRNIMKDTNQITHVNFLEFVINEYYNNKKYNGRYESNNTCEFPGIFRKWITITKTFSVYKSKAFHVLSFVIQSSMKRSFGTIFLGLFLNLCYGLLTGTYLFFW